MKKILIIALILLFGCEKSVDEQIVITGSETMHTMMSAVANEFMKRTPGYKVDVRGGGSLQGIRSLLENKTDIAVSSKELSDDELQRLEFNKKQLEVTVIAYDGIAIIVNKNNKADKIDLMQLADVYAGKIKNWKELGGSNAAVEVVVRNDNSGTSAFFKTYVLRKKYLGDAVYEKHKNQEYVTSAKIVSDNNELAEYIKKHPGAIGYMGMGSAVVEHGGELKVLKFSRTASGPFVSPTPESVFKREYKLNRALYMIYKPDQGLKVDRFATFVLSKDGQNVILKSGYLKSALKQIEVKGTIE